MTEIELTVILPTFNGGDNLRSQLSALASQVTDRRWELVVVNNESTDNTADIVRQFMDEHDWIRLVEAPDRHNLSYVRNVGVSATSTGALAFVDDDDIVGVGWVDAMCRALQDNELVGSRLDYDKLNSPEDVVGRERYQSEHIHEMFGLPALSGAGFGCRRRLWDLVGGNDEELSDSGEDFDFSMRVLRDAGILPVLATDAVYHYKLRGSAKSTWVQARRYGRSHVKLYARHARGTITRRKLAAGAARDWWWILTRAPLAIVGTRRSNWSRIAGKRVGRLDGSIRYRCFLP